VPFGGKSRVRITFWYKIFHNINFRNQGRIQDFKLGGGALKKIAPSGGRRENYLGLFRVKIHDFTPKKANYRFSLLPLTSNSKNKTVVSKLHCITSKEYLVTEHAVFSGKEVKNVLTNLAVILEFE
jgi:hypothetical protein